MAPMVNQSPIVAAHQFRLAPIRQFPTTPQPVDTPRLPHREADIDQCLPQFAVFRKTAALGIYNALLPGFITHVKIRSKQSAE